MKPLVFGSVCSGIGAPEAAWKPLGWRCAFMSEIEAFPRAILAHHWPEVPLHGDFTTIQAGDYDPIDLLVGGTPCQSFSVAGLRGGMADDRGNLALQFLALAGRLRPKWVVWENVPGVLSSAGGRDFGSFVGGLGELGYGWAYRTLDAQHFGVPQRRRRVFVVGYLGDWRRAAAVLFERHSLSGHPAPRREAGERTARPIAAGSPAGSGYRNDADTADNLIARCVTAGEGSRYDGESVNLVAFNITPSNSNKDYNARPSERAQAITGSGNRPSARGGDLIAETGKSVYGVTHADAEKTRPHQALRALCEAADEKALSEWSFGILAPFWPQEVLRSEVHGRSFRCSAFPERGLVNVALSCAQAGRAWTVQEVWQAGCDGCPPQGWRPSEQLARELGAYLSELPYSPSPAARFLHDMWSASEGLGLLRQALSAVQEARRSAGGESQPTQSGSAVRRLIVEECEALQGFPRSYTAVTYRGKPAADGPRYKGLGNSMAIPVVAWIGERIAAVAATPAPQRMEPVR